ncbi:hypothetical protein NL676_019494 [Syzygium grande]|nr:hypothetical protein NL676_019494 [Syzygium grande]
MVAAAGAERTAAVTEAGELYGWDTRQRSSWPELVRVDGKSAKQIIENFSHLVTSMILPPGGPDFLDTCCNRVVIYVNDKGITIKVPEIG